MIFGDKSIPSEQQQTIWNEVNTKLDIVSPLKADTKSWHESSVVTLFNSRYQIRCHPAVECWRVTLQRVTISGLTVEWVKDPGPLDPDCKSWYHPRNNLNGDGEKNQKYFFTRSISNFQLWPGMGKFCTSDETLWASFCMNFLETLGILFIPGHKKMFTFFQRHLYRAMRRYKVPVLGPARATHFMHRLFILTPFSHFYAALSVNCQDCCIWIIHPNLTVSSFVAKRLLPKVKFEIIVG